MIVNEKKVIGLTENILLIFPLNRAMRVQNTGNALIFKQSTNISLVLLADICNGTYCFTKSS
jgi:hypothetical protein